MSNTRTAENGHKTGTDRRRKDWHSTVETKPAFKTTELVVWALSVLGVLIAAAVADNAGAGGFGADHAWLYVTILSTGYMISRGLAKAGSYQKDTDPRSS